MMLRGAANTLVANATQIHPRSWTRFDPFARKWEKRRIEQNPPKFSNRSILKVNICSSFLQIKG